jgi:hypothetical protein
MVKELGGCTVWINRPGFGPVNEHISDNALDATDFDLIVCNEGSIEDLQNRAFDIARRLG